MAQRPVPRRRPKPRRIDNHAEVTILQKNGDPSMASCGYPYCVGGFFDKRSMLLSTHTGVVRDAQSYLNTKEIEARVNTEGTAVDRAKRIVSSRNTLTGKTGEIAYTTS